MSVVRPIIVGIVIWFCWCTWCVGGEGGRSRLPKIRIAADGRTFETGAGRPFVPIGVNYYRPGTGWAPQLWKKFDAEATRRDFAQMKQLGVTCVRVFLTYGSFFTQPGALDSTGLAKFDEFLEIAEQAGIYVHPTGPDHWEGVPPWAATDRVADEHVLTALTGFWRIFANRYRGRHVIFAFDLLNEPQVAWDSPPMRVKWNRWLEARYGTASVLAQAWQTGPERIAWSRQPPPAATEARGSQQLLDYQHFRESVADDWTQCQVAAIKSADPEALVTVGLIQWSIPVKLSSLKQYAAFRPARQAKMLDFVEIHFYPLARGVFDYTSAEDEQRNLAYLESVVRELAVTARPVVLAEFGWYGGGGLAIGQRTYPAATEEDQARWCRRAVETTAGLATGWLNWGFHDHPQARDVSQLTGLLTVDGKRKAWAREFQGLAQALAVQRIKPVTLAPRPTLDWDRCLTSLEAGRRFHEEYYQSFRGK